MNPARDSSYLTDDNSRHDLTDMSELFLPSTAADHIKTEPPDVLDQVGHVTVTSHAPAVPWHTNAHARVFRM